MVFKYRQGTYYMHMGLHNESLTLQHSQLNPNQFEAHQQSVNLERSM